MSPRCFIVLALALAGSSGCAHVIQIESTPPGATVLVDGEPAGRTPLAHEEKTGRDDLVSVEVVRDGRSAHFAYQKTGVSTDALLAAAATSCGMCAVGGGGLVGLVIALPTLAFLAAAPEVFIGAVIAAYVAYTVGLLLVSYAPYAFVIGIGEGGRKGPERIHVDFTKGAPLVTTTPAEMTVPLVGRRSGAAKAEQRY